MVIIFFFNFFFILLHDKMHKQLFLHLLLVHDLVVMESLCCSIVHLPNCLHQVDLDDQHILCNRIVDELKKNFLDILNIHSAVFDVVALCIHLKLDFRVNLSEHHSCSVCLIFFCKKLILQQSLQHKWYTLQLQ